MQTPMFGLVGTLVQTQDGADGREHARAQPRSPHPRRRSRAWATAALTGFVGLVGLGGACSPGDDGMVPPDVDGPMASFKVRQSVEQLHVTHAPPGGKLEVVDGTGRTVASGEADLLGSLVFRGLTPGGGYTVRLLPKGGLPLDGMTEMRTGLTVMSVAGSRPDVSFYKGQKLAPGRVYIKTRDGTELSAYVTLPGPPEKGPYPTVVNYSGYSPSKPSTKIAQFEGLCGQYPVFCDVPGDESALIASLMGYATVGVNMRGTGCSGGAYDYFDTLQLLDAYDVIETVAAQDFVLHHRVGTTGLSYPGISQLFTASQQPPSLAAITPLSVIGATVETLAPGGLLNTGFALNWTRQVQDRAAPYGQGWEKDVVEAGDKVCAENQLLHGQKRDLVKAIEENPFYRADLLDGITPELFAPKIQVPVFLSGAWQDEQTGPYFTRLMERLGNARLRKFVVYNGVHPDGFSPHVVAEWKTFLDLYVAKRIPTIDPKLRSLASLMFQEFFGAPMDLPAERFDWAKTYEEALAAYEKEPELRVALDVGAGMSKGAPEPVATQLLPKWPPEIAPRRLYLRGDGSLRDTAPAMNEMPAAAAFKLDPTQGQRGVLAPGGRIWDLLPKFDWKQPQPGFASSFLSEPLGEDTLLIGTGSADLFIQSSADDADLQVSLSEVRSDDKEVLIQLGYLRASQRKLASDSTAQYPAHTYLREDVMPLPAGQWTEVRVLIPAFGHLARKGSRLRIGIDTPGGTKAEWKFKLKEFPGEVTHKIAHTSVYPSSVLLPVLKDTPAPKLPVPDCPSLRGQPCRAYVPLTNTPGG